MKAIFGWEEGGPLDYSLPKSISRYWICTKEGGGGRDWGQPDVSPSDTRGFPDFPISLAIGDI